MQGLARRRHLRDGASQVASGGVVDGRLRVHGVDRLRVCEASIMPRQSRARFVGDGVCDWGEGGDGEGGRIGRGRWIDL